MKKKLIYKNFFGRYKILITKTASEEKFIKCTLVPDIEIYNSHIWIHDNIINKNHTEKEIFILNSFIGDDELKKIFGKI